ncbi:palmdelphin [Rhinatrema bivittatum]|uniref:palmdelphin n=1 Tax=Rhinatrema bivittatum TaxID=194408 RepID=UPI00112D84E8|nr:palmdelphin [Rhinatrema bivittatum]
MEEVELLKERLQAITDKRKLQEEIAQKRLKVEEEKLKLHHLKKKTLREKWLLDGLSALTAKEQEEMQKHNQEDQEQTKLLEQSILRVKKEIEDLEKEEVQISTKEAEVLSKLKLVEKTAEEIIKAVKADVQEEPAGYIYSNIPDLPKSFKPSVLKRMGPGGRQNGDESRKALFAMEIKVEKDMKTGESTVLSTIPVPSDEFKGTGVKVYDDGRKSIYAVSSEGKVAQNGIEKLAATEVDELLRKATEKSTKSPTELHEPVFSNQFSGPAQQAHGSHFQETKGKETHNLHSQENESLICTEEEESILHPPKIAQKVSEFTGPKLAEQRFPSSYDSNQMDHSNFEQAKPNELDACRKTGENGEAVLVNSECPKESFPPDFEEDARYNIVHAMPCYIDDNEAVTMIFMGYQHADESGDENKPILDYDGIIHAERVVIDDDDDGGEEEKRKEERSSYHPSSCQSQADQPVRHNVAQKSQETSDTMHLNHKLTYKNSISIQEQEESLSCPVSNSHANVQILEDGTEDPSLTALRIRMAKLGKKVI